jgi:hypothetical protein
MARRGFFGIRPGDLISGSIGSTISLYASVKSDGYRRCPSMPYSSKQPAPARTRRATATPRPYTLPVLTGTECGRAG